VPEITLEESPCMHDLIYCFRMLRKRPSFTIVAVLTLALAIGASTALFSIVNIVVLNPFPYKDPSRLFFVRQSMPKLGVQEQIRSSGPEFADFTNSGIFERVAAVEPVSRNLTGSFEPERLAAAKVSTEFFNILGVEPVLGRTIAPNEQGPDGQRVLVISYGLWQKRFGGDSAVLGQKVFLDDEPFTIVGVMPPQFRFEESQAWFPFPFDLAKNARDGRAYLIIVRTSSATTDQQVNAALANLARRNEQDFGGTNQEYAGRGIYLQSMAQFYFGQVRRALYILLGAVGLVLLISCANIANLLLARSMSRSHEIAIRNAMGASRARIIRQMLIESAVLGLLGGGLGLLIASWGTKLLFKLMPTGILPTGVEITMNTRVLLFTLIVSLVTAFIFGLWPAIQGSRTQTREALQAASKRSTAGVGARRAQSVLVVAEVALSLVLLVMAGLMIRSFAKLTNIDPGMSTSNVVSMRINRSPAKSKDGSQNSVFFQQVIDRVKTLPGVEWWVLCHTRLFHPQKSFRSQSRVSRMPECKRKASTRAQSVPTTSTPCRSRWSPGNSSRLKMAHSRRRSSLLTSRWSTGSGPTRIRLARDSRLAWPIRRAPGFMLRASSKIRPS